VRKLSLTLLAACFTIRGASAGEVRGVVKFAGAPPAATPLRVTKDTRTCGAEVPDESLLVENGRLANVVVSVKGAPAAPPAHATLDQQGCRFVPHVQAVPLGSTLEIANDDPLLHNIHGWLGRMTEFNVPQPSKGMRTPAKLERPGVIAVRCDVHGWMSAWLVVAEGPAAVAGRDGSFTLRDVPPGSYTVTAWHERLGEKTAQVKVPAQGSAAVEFTFGG
jgi:plastocyanin